MRCLSAQTPCGLGTSLALQANSSVGLSTFQKRCEQNKPPVLENAQLSTTRTTKECTTGILRGPGRELFVLQVEGHRCKHELTANLQTHSSNPEPSPLPHTPRQGPPRPAKNSTTGLTLHAHTTPSFRASSRTQTTDVEVVPHRTPKVSNLATLVPSDLL